MTVTLIINTENLSFERARCAKEGFSSLSLVDIKESDARYCERLGTYLAAAGAYEALFSRPMPKLYFDECGKPYFIGYGEFTTECKKTPLGDGDMPPHKDGLYISLSHRRGIAAVSFSNYPCGVDVEGKRAKVMLGRLTKRLISRIKGKTETLSLKYMTATLNESGQLVELCELPCDKMEKLNSPLAKTADMSSLDDFILSFTVLEAAAKCTGLGIGNFLDTGGDITGFSSDSIRYLGHTVTTFIKMD